MLASRKYVEKPEIDIVDTGNGILARLNGRIDIDSSPAVRNGLLAILRSPHPRTVNIDFSAVTHIDSSGIATLIEAQRIARGYNTEVKLQGLEGRLLRLFQLTGILPLFNGSMLTNSQCSSKAV